MDPGLVYSFLLRLTQLCCIGPDKGINWELGCLVQAPEARRAKQRLDQGHGLIILSPAVYMAFRT